VRSCVRPVCATVKPLAIMLCADRVPIVRAHFKSAMTQTGSPDPRIDLVCITSSCPRQFLQNFGTPSSLPGLTSFNRSGFDATSLWHFDAAEQAPSTASFTSFSRCPRYVRSSPNSGGQSGRGGTFFCRHDCRSLVRARRATGLQSHREKDCPTAGFILICCCWT
jgi:hypothetical protein